MSKKSDAKDFQKYSETVISPACGNCKHRRFKEKRIDSLWKSRVKEVSNSCSIGGFAVKTTATCNLFEFSTTE